MVEVDFDRIIDRSGTNAIATDGFREYLFDSDDPDIVLPCADADAIAMWVADMAFASAPAALDAMRQRLERPIFGYTVLTDDQLCNAFAGWCERHYGWTFESEHFVTAPGIVPALHDLVEFVLRPGQKAVTLTPGYAPFERAAKHHGRELLTCGLIGSADGRVDVDLVDLEAKLADPLTRLFFLCHPHNPTGRSWSDDELRAMAKLAFDHNVIVVSDEIHCDLRRSGLRHTPLAKLFPDSDQIITAMSASKTFNLAGLGIANLIIPNDEIREIWLDRNFPIVNPLSAAGATGAFLNGDAWLMQLHHYLDANFELVRDTLARDLPGAVFRIPDSTYLAWVDVRAYFPDDVNLTRHYAEQVGLLLEGGEKFVADAEGHVRLNLALPRSVLTQALNRFVDATPTGAPA